MTVFEQSGEALLLAHEGERAIAEMLAAQVRTWFSKLTAWHAAMPTSLPPTEAQPH